MINILDLFSGGGGLTEGFRKNQFKIVAHVEMDKNACLTLKLRDAYYYLKENHQLSIYQDYIEQTISAQDFFKYIPAAIKEKTINEQISNDSIPSIFTNIDHLKKTNKIDGIIGGPPCQAYSTIGRARNLSKKESDTRIYLYQYYTQFLKHYSPDFFVFENVKGLKSFKDIHGDALLPQIIEEFSNALGKNTYCVNTRLVDASVLGVPQKRERLIIFGYKSSRGQVDFFKHLLSQKELPITVRQLFQDLPFLHSGETSNKYGKQPPSKFVADHIRTSNLPLTQNIARPNNENDLEIYRIVAEKKSQNQRVRYPDLPKRLIKHQNKDIFVDRFTALPLDAVSHTVVAHIAKDGHYYIHPDVSQNRSITVREAARIQTFPDDYFFETSRTSAFTQIGNAVPPYLSKKISTAILSSLYTH